MSARPPLPPPAVPLPPAGARDLSSGNPDPAPLPPLQPALSQLRVGHQLYTERPGLPRLLELAAAEFGEDRIETVSLAVVRGALDGIERVLGAHLAPGERVAVEDPGFPRVFDLLGGPGLVTEPVAVDDFGPIPEALERALASSPGAVVLTPRAQNPTDAALNEVAAGQRFRLRSPSAVRVTVATLREVECESFASDLARSLRPGARTYAA